MGARVIDERQTALGVLRLLRYDTDEGPALQVEMEGEGWMLDREEPSDRALATLACDAWRQGRREDDLPSAPGPARVLIGGLGFGFTLAEALRLPGVREVIVAEILPEIVEWARGRFAPLNAHSLDDPRARVVTRDVADLVFGEGDPFDLILLDVDATPESLLLPRNARLYGAAGLAALAARLNPGGVLAVWSLAPLDALVERLAALEPLFCALGWRALHRREGGSPRWFALATRSRLDRAG